MGRLWSPSKQQRLARPLHRFTVLFERMVNIFRALFNLCNFQSELGLFARVWVRRTVMSMMLHLSRSQDGSLAIFECSLTTRKFSGRATTEKTGFPRAARISQETLHNNLFANIPYRRVKQPYYADCCIANKAG